ncbi:DUF1569 domain-containing protein [Winogradskyella flava]|uniref:DUF1569 domain-containing protein n=1 Tax=Winogradskyella flava TaxID=1884876 RepID=A0A842IMS7_9FLAO|nr:DUF1569 domain-containing protein [Winogradskyella flava]MBC2844280.1 DUF1569 domain-containing protein [Winogradskyella flava]
MKNTHKLSIYLDTIESYIPRFEENNLKVSKSTVGWQLDHCLKVINNVSTALETSDFGLYQNNFSVLGKLFLALGYFPRGKGKAPKHVIPPEVILKADLISQLESARSNVKNIANLDTNAFFKHPLFGDINTKRVYRFLEVHTNHHLKIIKDMLK